jgi:hypothetical protein
MAVSGKPQQRQQGRSGDEKENAAMCVDEALEMTAHVRVQDDEQYLTMLKAFRATLQK